MSPDSRTFSVLFLIASPLLSRTTRILRVLIVPLGLFSCFSVGLKMPGARTAKRVRINLALLAPHFLNATLVPFLNIPSLYLMCFYFSVIHVRSHLLAPPLRQSAVWFSLPRILTR